MKTRILFSTLLTVIFLVAFSGCNILKQSGAQSGNSLGAILPSDSVNSEFSDEEILSDNPDINSQGMPFVNSDYNSQNIPDNNILENTDGSSFVNTSTGTDEEILNDNPESGEDIDNVETFESSLADDGQFVSVSREEVDPDVTVSGETTSFDVDVYTNIIWIPSTRYVHAGWNPYSNGRWVWSRHGWTWVSNYRWGWATYHYGRWWYSSRYGWVWSPGRRWAPAWVVWGHHRNYEGWHPISPRVRIHRNGTISHIMPHNTNNGWVIVKKTDFTKTVNSNTIVADTKKNDILKKSTVSITLKQDGKNLFNAGPDINRKENKQQVTNESNQVVQTTTKKTVTGNSIDTKKLSDKKQNVIVNNDVNKKTGNNTQKKVNEINNVVKNTQKKVNENKNEVNINNTQKTKQNNTTNVNSNDNKVKETPKKVIENKKNEFTTPVKKQENNVNTNKSNTVEKKTTVQDNQKKKEVVKQVQEEKKTNNNVTKSYNSNTNTRTENTVKQVEKPVVKTRTENTNKTVTPKVEQAPKVNKEKVNNTQQKTVTKKGD